MSLLIEFLMYSSMAMLTYASPLSDRVLANSSLLILVLLSLRTFDKIAWCLSKSLAYLFSSYFSFSCSLTIRCSNSQFLFCRDDILFSYVFLKDSKFLIFAFAFFPTVEANLKSPLSNSDSVLYFSSSFIFWSMSAWIFLLLPPTLLSRILRIS